MGVFDWIGDLMFGDPETEAPKYQAPPAYQTPTPYQAPAPYAYQAYNAPTPYTYTNYTAPTLPQNATELPTVAGDNLSDLGGLFSELLNQYRTTGSATAPGVEQAMMDEARRQTAYDTGQAQQQISENMNRMGLLNSTAHGTASALNQQNGLRNLLDANSRVLQQRQANQQNMMQFGQGLAPLFTQRAQAQLAPRQWGYEQQAQNAQFGHSQGQQAGQYGYGQAQQAGQFGHEQGQQASQYGYGQSQQAGQYGYGQAQQAGQFGYGQQMQNAENQYASALNPYNQEQNRNNMLFSSLIGLANPLNWAGSSRPKSSSSSSGSYSLSNKTPSQYFGFGGY